MINTTIIATLFAALAIGGCEADCPTGSTLGDDGRCENSVTDAGASDAAAEDAFSEDTAAGDTLGPDAVTEDAGCTSSSACDDDAPCNGVEVCVAGTCEAGETPTEMLPCGMGETAGVCFEGTCRTPGCGNGLPDVGEDCDDGNEDAGDGCEVDCTFTCAGDTDCDNADACDGLELCNMTTHVCEAGVAPDCEDSDACTADSCDAAMGCVNTLIDEDGDGYSHMATCATAGLRGGDCEPTLPLVNPGAGFQATGYCPGGGDGCVPGARSFDYNCNSMTDLQHTRTGRRPSCAGRAFVDCIAVFRWNDRVPACGATAPASWCFFDLLTGTGCVPRSGSPVHACR